MEKENLFKTRVEYKERYHQERLFKLWRKDEVLSLLLDNNLITPTNKKRVDIKLICCGDYKQVYYNVKPHLKKDSRVEKFKNLKFMKINNNDNISTFNVINSKRMYDQMIYSLKLYDYLKYNYEYLSYINFNIKKKQYKSTKEKMKIKKIELKNILRSRFEMQRLVKTNEKIFKTFITLTFADNITDVKEANKKFDIWRTKVKTIYKDFAYVCVPEFQKRGAIHYHLLTNLDIKQSPLIIIPQKGKTTQYDVKYWSYGFTSVFDMKDINVVGYISKYMTKDIDNRLWGHRRYLYSQNLKKPEVINIDLSNLSDFALYVDLVNTNYNLVYSKEYTDFLNNDVIYEEYKKMECVQ